jgi:hypothetical protein
MTRSAWTLAALSLGDAARSGELSAAPSAKIPPEHMNQARPRQAKPSQARPAQALPGQSWPGHVCLLCSGQVSRDLVDRLKKEE